MHYRNNLLSILDLADKQRLMSCVLCRIWLLCCFAALLQCRQTCVGLVQLHLGTHSSLLVACCEVVSTAGRSFCLSQTFLRVIIRCCSGAELIFT